MQCTYFGNFDSQHTTKKRRLIGFTKEKAIESITKKNISAETFREKEANRLMQIGKTKLIKLNHFLFPYITLKC